ncbi:MAG: rRNA pseudouridine synthase [Lachnospiraceae bacterium]|nr:rRNA pseudouridine synthase [Lachnospiraceae bacterium]
MRLDRFLSEMNIGTRAQVKTYVRQGLVAVNGITVKSPDVKIREDADHITFRGKLLSYQKYVYYMLNKPEGVVSATNDNTAETVVSLLGEDRRKDIFPVGRLDKDTTGLLLLTNDGELAHLLLSPKRHVDKTYQATVSHPLTPEDVSRLEQGVDIGEEHPTLPARVSVGAENTIFITVQEGKFHQIKRMLQAVDNSVLALKRITFGCLELDRTLKPGEYRALTDMETGRLRELVCPLWEKTGISTVPPYIQEDLNET